MRFFIKNLMINSMRNTKQGFTVVEIMIVVIIVSLFVTLGSIGFSKVSERTNNKVNESNAFSIGLIFENSYNTGLLPNNSTREKATYPSLDELTSIWQSTVESQSSIDDDLSYIEATSNSATTPLGELSADATYLQTNYRRLVYQPLDQSGELCSTGQCASFNLYFVSKNGAAYSLAPNVIKSRYR